MDNQEDMMQAPQASRRGGRGERRALRTKPNHNMLPHLHGQLPLTQPMSQDQVEMIESLS